MPFFFEIGAFTDATGRVVHGDIARFFAGDSSAGVLGGAYFLNVVELDRRSTARSVALGGERVAGPYPVRRPRPMLKRTVGRAAANH